jgi:hypothetical protein
MTEEERLHDIVTILYQYSARPPLKLPNESEIPKIARRLLDVARGPKSLWTKWSKEREDVAQRAADVWIPLDDLRDALNLLPGEPLTPTDVEQRIIAVRQEFGGYQYGPDDALKEASFAAYREERDRGTEFIAILGWLEEWTWGAAERLRRQQDIERRDRLETDKRNAEARLKSGADCPWTAAADYPDLHSRKNGRLFRLKVLEKTGTPLAPRFEVLEVSSFGDRRGTPIGRYRTRTDASRAVAEVAYNPQWR